MQNVITAPFGYARCYTKQMRERERDRETAPTSPEIRWTCYIQYNTITGFSVYADGRDKTRKNCAMKSTAKMAPLLL